MSPGAVCGVTDPSDHGAVMRKASIVCDEGGQSNAYWFVQPHWPLKWRASSASLIVASAGIAVRLNCTPTAYVDTSSPPIDMGSSSRVWHGVYVHDVSNSASWAAMIEIVGSTTTGNLRAELASQARSTATAICQGPFPSRWAVSCGCVSSACTTRPPTVSAAHGLESTNVDRAAPGAVKATAPSARAVASRAPAPSSVKRKVSEPRASDSVNVSLMPVESTR